MSSCCLFQDGTCPTMQRQMWTMRRNTFVEKRLIATRCMSNSLKAVFIFFESPHIWLQTILKFLYPICLAYWVMCKF